MEQAPTQVVEIVTNIDDATGQEVGLAMQTLLKEGALDVWATPITMKKNRPAVMLSVLCRTDQRQHFAHRIISLTGAFGVRWREWQRVVLDRHHQIVNTEFGAIRVKVGALEGKPVAASPEFEDVRRAAADHGVSIRQVLAAVARAEQP